MPTAPTPTSPAPPNPGAHDAGHAAPLVELRGVHKSFGRQHVLRGIDLAFETGKTTVVLGPSGSGKSVILKHIVGLLKPDKGEVRFRGERIDGFSESQMTPVRRELGYLFQQSALFDSMSVADNLEFPMLEHTEVPASERRARIAEALATVDLAGVEAKFPAQLSGGQQKRVAMARAIILRPALILYDEPTTGLDPIRSDGISELILRMRTNLGVTGIVVTHDLACMRKVADHVVMLYGGVLIAQGTPDEIARDPNEHVQHFLNGQAEPDEADADPTPARTAGRAKRQPA
jgi:phospholipid/cholesterol/gamma-HCH transport system ATP-binding protein